MFPLLAALLLVACEGSSSPPPPPATPADLDKAIAASAKAFCDRVFECCDANGQSILTQIHAGGITLRDGCEPGVIKQLEPVTASLKTALAKAAFSFSNDKADKCVKDETAAACSDYFALGSTTAPHAACAAAFTGALKEGAACTNSESCQSGWCSTVGGDNRVCATPPAAGDTCSSATACGTLGLYCYQFTGTACNRTPSGTCMERGNKPDNASCCAAEECAGSSCGGNRKCTSAYALKCGG